MNKVKKSIEIKKVGFGDDKDVHNDDDDDDDDGNVVSTETLEKCNINSKHIKKQELDELTKLLQPPESEELYRTRECINKCLTERKLTLYLDKSKNNLVLVDKSGKQLPNATIPIIKAERPLVASQHSHDDSPLAAEIPQHMMSLYSARGSTDEVEFSSQCFTFKVICWNIKGKGKTKQRKETVSNYLNSKAADLIFLQEVPWLPKKWLFKKYLKLQPVENYTIACVAIEPVSSTTVNYVICDTTDCKLEVLPIDEDFNKHIQSCYREMKDDCRLVSIAQNQSKSYIESSPIFALVNENKRLCFITLAVEGTKNSEFVVACLHNKYKGEKNISFKMAILACKFLSLLSDKTGYPVLLAGDFNTHILDIVIPLETCKKNNIPLKAYKENVRLCEEIKELGFEILDYTETCHRERVGKIDFFLSRNVGNRTLISLTDVAAELAINGAVYIEGVPNKDMKTLDQVSNHDPLSATLHIEIKEQKLKTEKLAVVDDDLDIEEGKRLLNSKDQPTSVTTGLENQIQSSQATDEDHAVTEIHTDM